MSKTPHEIISELLYYNEKFRVTHIASSDPDDRAMVGLEGQITHPFPGLMIGSAKKYVAGLWVDPEMGKGKLIPSPLGQYEMNLMAGDRFEIVQ